jgi:negative regulator of sigma E activity
MRMDVNLRLVGQLTPVGAPEELLGRVSGGFDGASRENRALNHLRNMAPVEAPERLAGMVVAACQIGFQEDRATDRLTHLDEVKAPKELGTRINDLFSELRAEQILEGPGAPGQLESRVEQELTDLPQSISRRAMSKLPRVDAPEELRDLVARELAPARPLSLLVSKPMALLSGLAAAAALLVIANLQGVSPQNPAGLESGVADNGDSLGTAALQFEVKHPGSLSEFSPSARAFATQMAAGLEQAVLGSQRVDLGKAMELSRSAREGSTGGGTGLQSNGGSGSTNMNNGGTQSTGSRGSFSAGLMSTSGGPAYFNGVAQAPLAVAYRGTREVTSTSYYQGQPTILIYTEVVASNGAGQFTIQPTDVITPVMDGFEEESFLMNQESRQDFFFTHRDFRIRNFTNFWENYRVVDLAMSLLVANRPCDHLRIERLNGTGDHFLVAIDPATSLVLREERVDANGQLVSRVEFTNLVLGADLSDLQLVSSASDWTPSTLSAVGGLVVGPVLVPVAPPSGFELQSIGYQIDTGLSGEETWVQLTYGDGVEPVFFLFKEAQSAQGNAGYQNGSAGLDNNVVSAMSLGSWNIVDGRVDGREVLVVGRVSESELLLMLQSAFE